MKDEEESLLDSEAMQEVADQAERSEREREGRLEMNPDNGKSGIWVVEGMRHSVRIVASSAPEAVALAAESGAVEAWEFPEARYEQDLKSQI